MRKNKTIILLFAVAVLAIATLFITRNRAESQQPNDETQPVVTTEAAINYNAAPVQAVSFTEVVEVTEPEFTYSERIPLSCSLQEVMQQACKDYGVPYALALAVAECESCFDLEADSGICWGVMQINPCNYPRLRELGIEPTEYEGNIVAGVFMLGELLNKYGDTSKALMAYNCGETGARRLWDQGYETSAYSRKVMTQSDYWQQIIQN